jgi:site-specific DNA recombinase
LVDLAIWQRVQTLLKRNGCTGGVTARNKFGALLKGLLHCKHCDCAMSPSHSTKGGNKRYRYYLCNRAQKSGWDACPSKSIPAGEIERFVVEHIKELLQNPAVVQETIAQVCAQQQEQLSALEAEQRGLERDLAHWTRELHNVASAVSGGPHATARLADLQERIGGTGRRLAEVQTHIAAINSAHMDADSVTAAMVKFQPVWEALTQREQTRVVELLVERVTYDGASGKVAITFRSEALPLLAQQLQNREEAA